MTVIPLTRPHLDRSDAQMIGRFAIIGAGLATVWELVGPVGQAIIFAAAVFTAIGWLYTKMLRPAIKAMLRIWQSVDALEELPEFMQATDERMDRLEGMLTEIASEDRQAIKRAIDRAGD
jgi:hypothetical protein